MNVLSLCTAMKRTRRSRPWAIVLASISLGMPVWAGAADETSKAAKPQPRSPGDALASYVAASSQDLGWSVENVEIEASIPGLAKRGHLSAIRRNPTAPLPTGKPYYEVVATEGDRTVRQQVIARYLSAEVEAASLPPASVAVVPVNYRFRYVGSVAAVGTTAYAFEIIPHKKRAGLLRGQVWIDANSGRALRLMGYFVKSPSMFVRRIRIARDIFFRDGKAYSRVTHVKIATRLIGRAELTITELPDLPATE
jgi:hypothetical protein